MMTGKGQFTFLIFIILFNFPINAFTLVNDTVLQLDEGWEYRWGDCFTDEDGIHEWVKDNKSNSYWLSYSNNKPLLNKGGHDFIWFRIKLHYRSPAYQIFYTRNFNPITHFYLDNKPISKQSQFTLINEIPEMITDNYLYLRLKTNTGEMINPPVDGLISPALNNILVKKISENGTELIISAFLFSVGMIALLIFPLFKQWDTIAFSMLTIIFSIVTFTSTDTFLLMYKNQQVLSAKDLNLILFLFIPAILYLYHSSQINKKRKKILYLNFLLLVILPIILLLYSSASDLAFYAFFKQQKFMITLYFSLSLSALIILLFLASPKEGIWTQSTFILILFSLYYFIALFILNEKSAVIKYQHYVYIFFTILTTFFMSRNIDNKN